MTLKVSRVDTWAAPLDDKPGSLAARLNALAEAGVNLEFVIARRAPERPGTGVVFVTPIKTAAQRRAARKAGFDQTESLNAVRIEGSDKKGACGRIASALAESGLNLQGISAAAMKKRFVAHIAVDNDRDAGKAVRILKGL